MEFKGTKGKWIEIGTDEANELLKTQGITIQVLFDNGQVIDYNEEFPFAVATHIMECIKQH